MTWQAMQKAGLDCKKIFASVGMPDEPPDREQRRINSPQQRFWDSAEAESGDADIGLHIGELMPPFRGQVLEYLFLSSPTFGDGLRRAIRYNRLLTDAIELEFQVEDDVAILHQINHPVRHYLECAFVIQLRFLEHVTEGEFKPDEIWLPHQEGADPQEYQRVFDCPVRLGMAEGAILFDVNLLERRSPAAGPQLLSAHEQLAQQRLADLERRDLIVRVERELGDLMERGEVGLATVAERLHMTPRTLQVELARGDTQFKTVVANYRLRLARRLLARTEESIDQIVYLTGFSEPSAFTRAFKRWTGETPTGYRQRRRDERT